MYKRQVNGTAYTTQADDVTGVFTVTTATLNASTKLTLKVERNSVSSAVGAYNMSSGDITSLIAVSYTHLDVYKRQLLMILRL